MRKASSACFVASSPLPLRSTVPSVERWFCANRQYRPRPRWTASRNVVKAVSSASTVGQVEPRLLVDEILEGIKITENGAAVSREHKENVDEKLKRLIAYGDRTEKCYVEDETIFDDYVVSYTSSSNKYRPDGGGFRGKFFKNMGAFQHLLRPDIAVNSVIFKLAGIIPGMVGLYGKLSPDTALGMNGITIKFEPPRLRIFGAVWKLGNESQVRLRIAYLDDRVRIGVGSRGSLFVFSRCSPTEEGVQEWKKLLFGNEDGKPGRVIPYIGLQLFLTVIVSSILFLIAAAVRQFMS